MGARVRDLTLTLIGLLAVAAALCGCDGGPSSAAPSPPPAVVPGARSGPVSITLEEATPPAGSSLSGCGPQISGCVNRVRMRLTLLPSLSGPVLWVRAFLHASNRQACLLTETGPFTLDAGQRRSVELVFDRSDACGVPLSIENMAVAVEGPAEVASRQEWALRYDFTR